MNNRLNGIFIYNIGDKYFKKYTGNLPYGLSFDMVNSDIISKFGEPNDKRGGHVT